MNWHDGVNNMLGYLIYFLFVTYYEIFVSRALCFGIVYFYLPTDLLKWLKYQDALSTILFSITTKNKSKDQEILLHVQFCLRVRRFAESVD